MFLPLCLPIFSFHLANNSISQQSCQKRFFSDKIRQSVYHVLQKIIEQYCTIVCYYQNSCQAVSSICKNCVKELTQRNTSLVWSSQVADISGFIKTSSCKTQPHLSKDVVDAVKASLLFHSNNNSSLSYSTPSLIIFKSSFDAKAQIDRPKFCYNKLNLYLLVVTSFILETLI